jgi:phosphate:Na+ symporter
LKGLAGDALRRTLQRLVGGHFSAIVSGVLFTAAIQSSTAASLTVIGFVSAGLVTLPQAIGVIVGATLGTTTTPWMVAFLGFGVSVSAVALPMLGIGAFLWLIAKGRVRSSGAILAGFGLIFTGIEFLQDGMAGVSWNLEAIAGAGAGAKWILAGIGLAMTVIMQSSSAAAAATLVALYTGSLTFEQGCAMIVGQSVGSAATTALMVIGGSLAVRRTALAHILFTVIVGVLAMLFLAPLTVAAGWVGARLDDPDGVLALAAFQQHLQARGHRRLLSVARCLRELHRSPLRRRSRFGGQASRPDHCRGGRSGRARGCLAGDPGARAWRHRSGPCPARRRNRQV